MNLTGLSFWLVGRLQFIIIREKILKHGLRPSSVVIQDWAQTGRIRLQPKGDPSGHSSSKGHSSTKGNSLWLIFRHHVAKVYYIVATILSSYCFKGIT